MPVRARQPVNVSEMRKANDGDVQARVHAMERERVTRKRMGMGMQGLFVHTMEPNPTVSNNYKHHPTQHKPMTNKCTKQIPPAPTMSCTKQVNGHGNVLILPLSLGMHATPTQTHTM